MIFLEENQGVSCKTAVTIGMFDGMHMGHRKLINSIKSKENLKSLIFSFERSDEENLIFTNKEKRIILESLGCDYAVLQPYSGEFLSTSKEDFLDILKNKYNAGYICCGEDFRFGKNALGCADDIREFCEKNNIEFDVMSEYLYEGKRVSSSRIRECIKNGEMQKAAQMLGGLYFIDGVVEKGNMLGRTMDFPTVNLSSVKILPSFGVYASFTLVDGKIYKSISNVGVKPTIADNNKINVETNIFDFHKDVYGKEIRVYLAKKIRGEKKFCSLESLKNQMEEDKIKSLEFLSDKDIYKQIVL